MKTSRLDLLIQGCYDFDAEHLPIRPLRQTPYYRPGIGLRRLEPVCSICERRMMWVAFIPTTSQTIFPSYLAPNGDWDHTLLSYFNIVSNSNPAHIVRFIMGRNKVVSTAIVNFDVHHIALNSSLCLK